MGSSLWLTLMASRVMVAGADGARNKRAVDVDLRRWGTHLGVSTRKFAWIRRESQDNLIQRWAAILMYTIRYASSRREIWRWYWSAWARPRGLWRSHVLISLLSAIGTTAFEKQRAFNADHFLLVFAVTMVGCLVLLPLWPQIRFKPAVRTLKIHEKGFETVIGRRSGARSWKEVRSVKEADGTIVITGVNKNAFIVPSRAFASETDRLEFYEAARRFHAGSNLMATNCRNEDSRQ
jgi:hypothetical protein